MIKGSDDNICATCKTCKATKSMALRASDELFEMLIKIENLLLSAQSENVDPKIQFLFEEMLQLSSLFKVDTFEIRLFALNHSS